MAVRVISSLIGIPLLIFLVAYGGLPLYLAVLVISLIGMYELYKAVSGRIKLVHFAGFLLECLYINSLLTESIPLSDMRIIACLFIMLILFMMVVLNKTTNVIDGAITVFGFFYVGLMLSLICYIRDFSLMLAWLPFIFAFGSDTGAYFIGSKFGKHKLAPELSPKKSVEGAIGGVVFSMIISGIYGGVCSRLFSLTPEFIIYFAIMGAIGSVLAQIGDLAASSIKRYVGIKDFGKFMPGHGGVLDRFDSVLFTLPLVYVYMLILA